MKEKTMDEKEQPHPSPEETPEVYTVKKDLAGWRFNRRTFLAAAGTTAAAAAISGCGTPEPVVIMVTETASPVPPTATLIPAPAQPSDATPEPTNTQPPAATEPPPPPASPAQATVTEAPTNTPVPEKPQAEFVRDVTVPDGTVMRPNQAFTKTWRYRNNGNVPWGEGIKLVFVPGTFQGYQSNQMGGPDSVNVANVAPGDSVDISVNLVAPSTPARYRGYWRLQLPNGEWLENNHYVDIIVRIPGTATSPPATQPQATTAPACGCDGDCGCDKDCGCDGDCGCDRDSGGHYWHPN